MWFVLTVDFFSKIFIVGNQDPVFRKGFLNNRIIIQTPRGLVHRIDFMPLGCVSKGIADPKHSKSFKIAVGGGGFYNDGSTITTMGYSAYLHAKMMGVHLFAEFAQDKAEPTDTPTTPSTMTAALERRVMNASLGYVFMKNLMGIAVRYELLDDNLDKETQGDEWQLAATLTWYMVGDYLKAQLEYTHREELHGLSLDNDSVLGGVQLLF